MDWTLSSLAQDIQSGRLSPVEVTRHYLERIERIDPRLRAFISIDSERALAAAKDSEARLVADTKRGPLHGIPFAVKDLCYVPGFSTTCGTPNPEYFSSESECTAVSRLRAAGAIIVGKLNMTELALGPFGDNFHHGDVQNPWREQHCAGGSSSGSAAAVAARLVPGTLGSDTGGSIRVPAACCRVVGLKPTYGRVSRAGVMPLCWSMDHIGPMALTVRDVALLLGIIAGHDDRDATSSRLPVPDYLSALSDRIAGARIGIPENFFFEGLDPEVETSVRNAAEALKELGARLETVRLPDPQLASETAYLISRCESAALHRRPQLEQPHKLKPQAKARLEVAMHISAYDYLQALRLRGPLTQRFIRAAFANADVLLTPVIPEPAPPLSWAASTDPGEATQRVRQFTRFTRPFNGFGLPALTVPCGFSTLGLPLAFQLVGRPHDESTLLRIGHAYEQSMGWYRKQPALE